MTDRHKHKQKTSMIPIYPGFLKIGLTEWHSLGIGLCCHSPEKLPHTDNCVNHIFEY